ncbi:MAG: hypothetical protein L0Z62_23925 [Gemmataceae bacterium]|nr:hypothetical protein [Gemmataceae bacterium]
MRPSFTERLKEIGRFFAGRSAVHHTLFRLAKRLEEGGIPYAVTGGMAVNAHGHHQTTDDVDVLLSAEGLTEFRGRFAEAYDATPLRGGRRWLDRVNRVPVDVVVAGACPGERTAEAVRYPDPATVAEAIEGVCYLPLRWLIQVKLAARRHRDLGEVAALIRVHDLDESFLNQLHPSVHQGFIECLEEKRREDEYEAREG